MSEPASDLQFDHATYEAPPTGLGCGMCGKPVTGEYWQWLGKVACPSCRDQVSRLEEKIGSSEVFAKAALRASMAAFACGAGYAVVAGLFHIRMALITIGIAYVIAKVIRKATGNISGRKYQLLAVGLTYAASTMGYVPWIWDTGHLSGLGAGDILVRVGLTLVAPFLTATEAPLGLLIVGFGLWEAWRLARPLPMVVTGPFRVAPPAPPSPPAPPATAQPAPPS